MRTLPVLSTLTFLLSACGISPKDKLAKELIPALGDMQDDKRVQADRDFARYQQNNKDQNIKDEGFQAIVQVHAKAALFYSFSIVLVDKYRDRSDYPQNELIAKFATSYDSILALTPGLDLKHFDYAQSSHKENVSLTAFRMNYDMAVLETLAMKELAGNNWVTIIRDDFPQK